MKVFEIKCQLKKVFAMWCRRAAPWVAYGLLVKCDALCLITVCLDARIIGALFLLTSPVVALRNSSFFVQLTIYCMV